MATVGQFVTTLVVVLFGGARLLIPQCGTRTLAPPKFQTDPLPIAVEQCYCRGNQIPAFFLETFSMGKTKRTALKALHHSTPHQIIREPRLDNHKP
jgi:hypothetical protein